MIMLNLGEPNIILIMPAQKICAYLFCALTFISCKTSQQKEQSDGFVRIFNGENLDGWKGDSVYWRVENGILTGEVTPATIMKRNTFIIWQGGEVGDFELKFDYRITEQGNSGINYRSVELPELPFALRGYQGDIDGQNNYTGMNYEERGRTTLAERSQKTTLPAIAADSFDAYIQDNHWKAAVVSGATGNPDSLRAAILPPGSWNEYHIIARDNLLQHYVNGKLMSEVTDNDTANARKRGLIGVQVHVGPPMKVDFRNIYLKQL